MRERTVFNTPLGEQDPGEQVNSILFRLAAALGYVAKYQMADDKKPHFYVEASPDEIVDEAVKAILNNKEEN